MPAVEQTTTPLAARMRPRSLDEIVGQSHLLAPDARLRAALDRGQVPSLLLWGPPGCGKTTLAGLLADLGGLRLMQLSAVNAGLKDLREIIARAQNLRAHSGRGVLLFLDEIHRWSRSQQDALLPHVEEGTVVLVGATTENPAFEIIPALRSRCWLVQLHALEPSDLRLLLERALQDEERGLGQLDLRASPEALDAIAAGASGDARRALSVLDRVSSSLSPGEVITLERAVEVLGRPDLLHDATGDAHFDVMSALIKSMRGSDPDAALYWLARMIEGGEDAMVIARRLVVFAAEDVGNAEPRALTLAVAASQATQLVGLPEARIPLAQAAIFLATAPKSNASYTAINRALETVRRTGALTVPNHLRNAPTSLAKQLGHGAGYLYPHDFPDQVVAQAYLPVELSGSAFYVPTQTGAEKTIGERLAWWRRRLDDRKKR